MKAKLVKVNGIDVHVGYKDGKLYRAVYTTQYYAPEDIHQNIHDNIAMNVKAGYYEVGCQKPDLRNTLGNKTFIMMFGE